MLAFFHALPVLLLVAATVLAAFAGAGWLRLLSMVFQGSAAAAASSGIAVLAALAVVELATRQLQRRRRFRWLCTADALGFSRSAKREDVGGAAWALGRAASLGVPIAPCLIGTSALGARLLAASAVARESGKFRRALPFGAQRQLQRFLAGCHGAEVVVRSSFVLDDEHGSHAGVFATARAASGDIDEVVSAMLRVLASRDGDVARAYRRRLGLSTPLATALVIEVVTSTDAVHGSVCSRGLEGRTDTALLEYARPRSPTKTVHFDYLAGEAKPLVEASGSVETLDWMRQVAWVALLVEEQLGGAVQLDFIVMDGAMRVRAARRVPAFDRRTFTCFWPVALGASRLPALFHDLRGGLAVQREAISAALAGAGVPTAVGDDEVRYFDGVPYVDAAVARRALAAVARAVLLGDGARRLLALLTPTLPVKIPAFAEPAAAGLAGWRELVAWQSARFVPLVQRYFYLGTRAAVLRSVRRLLAGGKAGRPLGHPLVRRLVTRRATAVVAEVRRLELGMTELELRMGAVAGRLISQGSGGWDQMFAGDRHVHLSIPMVEQWFGDDAARASLDAKWRERKAALEQREDRAPSACVHVPPIGAAAAGPASVATELRGAGLVSGVVQGTSAVVTRRDPAADAGSVVVLSDEAAEDARVVLDATGLVFLGSGACSAAATLARELGLPAVVCPDTRPGTLPHGRRIAVDSRQGLVRYG